MKRIAMRLFFFALAIFLYSCGKDISNISKSIEGEWELVRITGSRPVMTFSRGNGNVIKFTNSDYQFFENGSLLKSGTYTIVEDASVQHSVCLVLPAEQYRNRIIYDNDNNASKKFLQIANDTLAFVSGCFATDAGSKIEYVRTQ